MYEVGPEHELTYRQDLLRPLFQRIYAAESAAVVGAASMGKSRLLQFMLLRPDVRAHYLGDQATTTLLLWADCNRMGEISSWALYELIFTTLVEAAGEHKALVDLRGQLIDMRRDVIVEQNALLAQRNLELALRMICQERGLSVCIILDEFDECLKTLSGQTLSSLRSLRDANKYRLTYVLFLRDVPAAIRDPDDYEGFYELFSRSILGLTPYSQVDASRVLEQLRARYGHALPPLDESSRTELLRLSGRHPGLLVALVDALASKPPLGRTWEEWAASNEAVKEELRKLWFGLRAEERRLLNYMAMSGSENHVDFEQPAYKALTLKGLIQEDGQGGYRFFSPLFGDYARKNAPASTPLHVDVEGGWVFVDGRRIDGLTNKEFGLIVFLYQRRGDICSPDEIISHLYGDDEYNVDPNMAATWITRVRKKIEPNPKNPIYLLNERGRGYCLIVNPE